MTDSVTNYTQSIFFGLVFSIMVTLAGCDFTPNRTASANLSAQSNSAVAAAEQEMGDMDELTETVTQLREAMQKMDAIQ